MNIPVQPSNDETFSTPVRVEGERDFIVPAFLLISADTREEAEAKANELDEGINELLEMGDQSAIMVMDQEIPVEEWAEGSGDHDDAPVTLPIFERHLGILSDVEPLLHQYLSILRKLLEDNITTVKVDIVKVESAIKDIQTALEAQ